MRREEKSLNRERERERENKIIYIILQKIFRYSQSTKNDASPSHIHGEVYSLNS